MEQRFDTGPQSWKQYAIALLLFNILGAFLVYGLLRLQAFLPLNPQKFPGVSGDTAFNRMAPESDLGLSDV